MTPRPLIVIPEAAKAALRGESKTERWVKDKPVPRHPLIERAVAMHMRRLMFGPVMKPTFRQQCLQWTSFRALNAGRL